jgi:redox-sensitive bicupin YhaK (pirin superfamily)
MITIRRSDERGHFDHGWLDTRHTFSFAGYHDPEHVQFRALRVINEDIVQPGMGFGEHPHRDMEIVTYVLKGALEHKDSLGGGGVIRPGDVQRISAGSGVFHSEFNASKTEPVHLLQIWIIPEEQGLEPRYDQKTFEDLDGRLRVVASRDGRDGSLSLYQDVVVLAGRLGDPVTHELGAGRHAWVQVAQGGAVVNGETLGQGDAAAISEEGSVRIEPRGACEVLVFDLE